MTFSVIRQASGEEIRELKLRTRRMAKRHEMDIIDLEVAISDDPHMRKLYVGMVRRVTGASDAEDIVNQYVGYYVD